MPPHSAPIRFGDYAFVPGLRRLERQGVPVPLTRRALDLLAALADRPGEVVGKGDLLDRAWPRGGASEDCLRYQMVGLRRMLGDGDGSIIMTVHGVGYRLAGEAGRHAGPCDPVQTDPGPGPAMIGSVEGRYYANSARPSRIIGRDGETAELLRILDGQSFVTIVGPAGVGKSVLAHQAARHWRAMTSGTVVEVDLCDADEGAVVERIAALLGLAPGPAESLDATLEALDAGRRLLLLDNFDPAVDAVAEAAEAIQRRAPNCRLLATSREELRAEGETIYRLAPLRAPGAGTALTADEARGYPAIALFEARAARGAGFTLGDPEIAIVGDICRRLDGLPLAIEIVAAQVGAFGLQDLHALLEADVALAWPGPRTAVRRHHALGAAFAWSYGRLSDHERVALHSLAGLPTPFDLTVALGAAVAAGVTPGEAASALTHLVAKSLVAPDARAAGRFGLLNTLRTFLRAEAEAAARTAPRRA